MGLPFLSHMMAGIFPKLTIDDNGVRHRFHTLHNPMDTLGRISHDC